MQFFFNILVYPVHKNLYYSLKFTGIAPPGHATTPPYPHHLSTMSPPSPNGGGTVWVRSGYGVGTEWVPSRHYDIAH